MAKKVVAERQIVFNSKMVEEVTQKLNDGVILKRNQNPWMAGEVGIRRPNVSFMMTEEEEEEYIKCALDIHYFTEKYCKIKSEDGSVQPTILRDYQNEILDNFVNNRFNILCSSRQSGKCLTFNTLVNITSSNTLSEERLGILYYDHIKKIRKLTIIEIIKIKLWNLIWFIEKLKNNN